MKKAQMTPLTRQTSYFTGGTAKMLALVTALYLGTIFTLGIAYPWLSCALYRWEINNTIIGAKRQRFDGKGSDLFKNYIKWMLLTVVTLGIYKLWLTRNVFVWKVRHTHFEDSGNAASVYRCKINEKLLMLVRYYAIIICTLTLGKCWAECYKTKWTLCHTYIDGERLGFSGTGAGYFKECALCALLAIVTLGVYTFFIPVRLKRWKVEHATTYPAAMVSP